MSNTTEQNTTDLDLQIANKALTKLGLPTIQSFDSQEEAARLAYAIFETVRDYELATYPWAFAIKRTELTALTSAPAFGYKFQYALPTDFLRLEGIYNCGGADKNAYELEGNNLLTDIGTPLQIRYISRELDTVKWPPYFVEALATKLAYEMCERLKQDPQRKSILWQEYQAIIGTAKRCNAIQLAVKDIRPGSWELAHDEE